MLPYVAIFRGIWSHLGAIGHVQGFAAGGAFSVVTCRDAGDEGIYRKPYTTNIN